MLPDVRVCLLSPELAPFTGGGLGKTMQCLVDDLVEAGDEVTLVVTEPDRATLEAYVRAAHPRLNSTATYRGLDLSAAPGTYPWQVAASAALQCVRSVYAGRAGPDVVISGDYLALSWALLAAARSGDLLLKDTKFLTRTACTAELSAIFDGVAEELEATAVLWSMERWCLANSDLLWSQCDATARGYRRFYGDRLAPISVLPTPEADSPTVRRSTRVEGEPLRFMTLARVQGFKGTFDLVDAFRMNTTDDWSLTLIGSDTPTAPGDASGIDAIRWAIGDDPRINVVGRIEPGELVGMFATHDVVVATSTMETWGHAVAEAMLAGLPALVTPVGALPDFVDHGRLGWVCKGIDARSVGNALSTVLAEADRARRLRDSGETSIHIEGISKTKPLIDAIHELGKRQTTSEDTGVEHEGPKPLVSVVVPYFGENRWIGSAVQSLLAQTYESVEILIVVDGSFKPSDSIVYALAETHSIRVITTLNHGPSAARNLGMRHSEGNFVAFLDCDDVAEPEWVERLMDALTLNPAVAFVTSWMSCIDENGATIVGSQQRRTAVSPEHVSCERFDVGGASAALLKRSSLELASIEFDEAQIGHEMHAFHRNLRQAGLESLVIPEQLVAFRIRAGQLSSLIDERQREVAVRRVTNRLLAEDSSWN